MRDKVSIIVPIYKAEKYLGKCIESILNQTYKNIEIILIDDGSPDSSGELCDEYSQKDSRIVVVHKKNAGVSAARNTGLDLASGKYICFIDSDDWVEETYCETLCSKSNDTRLVVTNYLIEQKTQSVMVRRGDCDGLVSNHRFYSLRNLRNIVWNKLYITDILRENQIYFDTDLHWGEDLLFNLQYIQYIKEIYVINNPLYHYRRFDEETLDNKYHENLYDFLKRVHKELYKGVKGLKNNEEEMCYYYTTYFNYLLRAMNNTFHRQSPKSFYQKISYNNKIIRSEDFGNCLMYADLKELNKYYLFLLKTKNYILVYMANVVLRLLNSWRTLYAVILRTI